MKKVGVRKMRTKQKAKQRKHTATNSIYSIEDEEKKTYENNQPRVFKQQDLFMVGNLCPYDD